MLTVLFHRNFRAFTGGHLKVWNYFEHVASLQTHEPRIAFTKESKWDATNPWIDWRERVVDFEPEKADLLFLAGTDWRALQGREFAKPVINLIQHQRHAEPNSELRGYLKRRAIRICVSEEVAHAIKETGEVNGPVFVIPNGIDLGSIPLAMPWEQRGLDILVCGLKSPELARAVHDELKADRSVCLTLTERVPRAEYLAKVAQAKVTVFLPRPVEGFYLPPLEGMATETIVVCPDCGGNRGFCSNKINCLQPSFDAVEIARTARQALNKSESDRARMIAEGKKKAASHSLEAERRSFLDILGRVDEIW